MTQEITTFPTLSYGLIGLVLGWTVVLRCSKGIRPFKVLSIASFCLISLRIVAALFETSWWVAPLGLFIGASIHAAFLSAIQSNTINS